MHLFTLILGTCSVWRKSCWMRFRRSFLPRRASGRFRVSRIFMTAAWIRWRAIADRMRQTNRRESFLSYFGPLSLLMLVVIWASGLILGFGLLYHALGSPASPMRIRSADGKRISMSAEQRCSRSVLATSYPCQYPRDFWWHWKAAWVLPLLQV